MLGSERKSVAELGTEPVPWDNPLPQLQGNPSLTYACNSRSQLGYFFLCKTWGFSTFFSSPTSPRDVRLSLFLQQATVSWCVDKAWRGEKGKPAQLAKVTWPVHGREQLHFLSQNNISPAGWHIPRQMGLDSPSAQQESSSLQLYSSVSCKENLKCLNNPSSNQPKEQQHEVVPSAYMWYLLLVLAASSLWSRSICDTFTCEK